MTVFFSYAQLSHNNLYLPHFSSLPNLPSLLSFPSPLSPLNPPSPPSLHNLPSPPRKKSFIPSLYEGYTYPLGRAKD